MQSGDLTASLLVVQAFASAAGRVTDMTKGFGSRRAERVLGHSRHQPAPTRERWHLRPAVSPRPLQLADPSLSGSWLVSASKARGRATPSRVPPSGAVCLRASALPPQTRSHLQAAVCTVTRRSSLAGLSRSTY